MRRVVWSVGLMLVALAPAAYAKGQAATTSASTPAPAPVPAPAAPTSAPSGLAVVALPGATDAAWPLARGIYATASLRPAALDEPHARVLCGEPAPAGAPADVRDLAETVAAVHGDDAPSRAMLGAIAHRFDVRALVVVRVDAGHAAARVFLPDSSTFDAASYAPDDAPTLAWSAAVRSLARIYGAEAESAQAAQTSPKPATAPTSAPALALHEEPHVDNAPPKSRAFWQSGWFWGAIGAAAFAAGAVYFATRDNGPATIHLQMQVPH